MDSSTLPFVVQILDADDGPTSGENDFSSLLPATYRTKKDHIVKPQPSQELLEREMLVPRLTAVHKWLWLCGRPNPPRPLHHQIVVRREIIVTENVELHLVWSRGRIFIKPLPRFLLAPEFWLKHLDIPRQRGKDNSRQEQLRGCALGFLFSYTALISYESDFSIAQEKGLLPKSVTWENWQILCGEFLKEHCYNSMNPRYWYGELRLPRLNKIYKLRTGWLLRGYSQVAGYVSYGDRLRHNFATLATVFAYVAIVLTAMQVGLATDHLQHDKDFQRASYGFTVFSILAPLAAMVVIGALLLVLFVSKWRVTKKYMRESVTKLKQTKQR